MKRKRYSVFLTALLIACSTSCLDNASDDNGGSADIYINYSIDDYGFSRFDVEPAELVTYENKTKIVYLTNYDTVYTTTDEDPRIFDDIYIENAVNEYLDENGYDFYVDFIMNGEFDFITQNIYPNIEVYEQMLENGEQVDIVNTGVGLSAFGGYADTYHLFLEKGYLEPLNDYFQTEYGADFYAQFDEIVWEQTTDTDGTIYGKTTDYIMAQPLVLFFNDEVCAEYGFDTETVTDLNDLQTYLRTLSDNDISGLILDNTCELFYEIAGFSKYKGIYINTVTGKAENIFENADALEYLETIEEYAQNGYISNSYDYENNIYLCTVLPAMPLYYDSSRLISEGYLQLEYLNQAVGISSASEHKDEAFQLLSLLNTDSELANIIYNGTEGRNYIINDGVKYLNKNALPFYEPDMTMTNPLIADSNSQDNPDKKSDFEICWENSQTSPFYNFEISDDLEEKINEAAAIYDEFYPIFYGSYGEYEDLDAALSAANEKLKATGIDEVLDELNEQYRIFKDQ